MGATAVTSAGGHGVFAVRAGTWMAPGPENGEGATISRGAG